MPSACRSSPMGLCKLFRIDRSRLEMPLAQLLKGRLHPEDVPKVCEDLKNASRQPMGEYKAVYRLEPPDGSHIFVSVHGYRENQAGEACEFFSYFSDITAEMQQKAELEQARQKEQRVHILELQNHEMKHVEQQLWKSKELYKNTVDSLQIAGPMISPSAASCWAPMTHLKPCEKDLAGRASLKMPRKAPWNSSKNKTAKNISPPSAKSPPAAMPSATSGTGSAWESSRTAPGKYIIPSAMPMEHHCSPTVSAITSPPRKR